MKQKAKAFFEPPERKKALTLVILFCVFGTAMGFAMVDKDTSGSADVPIEYDETQIIYQGRPYKAPVGEETTGWRSWTSAANMSMYFPSENDGFFLIDSGLPGMTSYEFTINGSEWKDMNIRQMEIVTPMGLKSVYWMAFGTDLTAIEWKFTEESPGVWVRDLSMADMLILSKYSTANIKMVVSSPEGLTDGLLEFSLGFYDTPSAIYFMPYVAAMAGVLILICAFYALPHVSPGVSVKVAKKGHKKAKQTVAGIKNTINKKKGGKK